ENALLNLAVNARDAMPGGGRLSIEVSGKRLDGPLADRHNLPAGDYVTITVADTGTGMAGDVLERIFDPFFTTKPLSLGTGLGLSMVHGFMRQSDGQVHIESAPGKGTVIELLLPCHAGGLRGVSSSDAGAPAPSPPHAGLTILVVDDEPIVRMLMVELLEDAGYTVIE